MLKNFDETKNFSLTNASIDEASAFTQDFLCRNGTSDQEITRVRLSVEEVMRVWQNCLGTEESCTILCRKRFSRLSVRLIAKGKIADPYLYNEEDEDFFGEQGLLARLGLSGTFTYNDGVNKVLFSPRGKQQNPIIPVAVAILLALVTGSLCLLMPKENRLAISDSVVNPFFTMLMNLFSSLATPMIFLSVCSGIFCIGDMALLGKVGKKLISRFIGMTFAVVVGVLILTVWFFPVRFAPGGTGSGEAASAIYQMLLDIVPSNLISPFIEGNALQVIFLGCVCGIGMLTLGSRVSGLSDILEQTHTLIQLLMSAIGRIVPLFVFICVLDLCLSGNIAHLSGVGKLILLYIAVIFLLVSGYSLSVSHKTGVRIFILLEKLLPTFLIAVTTASSITAFDKNTTTCKEKLGVSEKLVDFGVPLGQVLYMPMGAAAFLLSALCIGELYEVTITPMWLLSAVLVSAILSIATPPIPGGALSCYTILFLQLGIPAAGVALAISIDLVMDFLLTAINLLCLQLELVLVAHNMNMLDEKVLRDK